MPRSVWKQLVTALFCATLVGCVAEPTPMTSADRAERSAEDLATLADMKFVPDGPVTLDQAIARAVAYNMKGRVKEIEREIADAELETRRYDMLPGLEVSGGREWASEKRSSTDDPLKNTASATATWNILDLGVSYARAKQQADQALIAREHERKALQDIVRKVRVAFRRAAGAQQLMDRVKGISRNIRIAMRESRAMEKSGAEAVAESVAYRREIIDAVRQALTVQRELRESRAELAELLNIPPGTPFTLDAKSLAVAMPALPMSLPEMESYALDNRPELRVEDYNERVSTWQAREALFNMLPAPKLSFGTNYSNDAYNITPNWLSAGFQLGMNIFGLFSGVSRMNEADQRGELARRQRLAMTVAVLTQTQMAYIQFRTAAQHMRLAREVARADRRLASLVASDTDFVNTNYLEAVQYATRTLKSEMEEHQAQVDLVTAHSELMHAIGLDVFPQRIRLDDLDALTGQVHKVTARWQRRGGKIDAPADTPLDVLVNAMLKGGEKGPGDPASPPRRIEIREASPDAMPDGDAPGETDRPPERPPNAFRSAAGPGALPAAAPDTAPGRPPAADETVVFSGRAEADSPLSEPSPTDPPPIDPPPDPADAAGPDAAAGPPADAGPVHVAQFGVFRSDARAARLRRDLTGSEDAPLYGVDVRIVRRPDGDGAMLNYVETAAIPDPAMARELCKTLRGLGRDCFPAEHVH